MNSKKPSKLIKLSTTTPTTPTPPLPRLNQSPKPQHPRNKKAYCHSMWPCLSWGLDGMLQGGKKAKISHFHSNPKKKNGTKKSIGKSHSQKINKSPKWPTRTSAAGEIPSHFCRLERNDPPRRSCDVRFEKESGKDVATSMPGQICICKYLYIIRVLLASWWLNQPIWKIMLVKLDHFPR